jgi:hypothetical protein
MERASANHSALRAGRLVLGAVSGAGLAFAVLLLTAPDVGPPAIAPHADKLWHFLAFACLTGPLALVLPHRLLWIWAAHMITFGAGIEVVQALEQNSRSASAWDGLANAAGVLLAVWLAPRAASWFGKWTGRAA